MNTTGEQLERLDRLISTKGVGALKGREAELGVFALELRGLGAACRKAAGLYDQQAKYLEDLVKYLEQEKL